MAIKHRITNYDEDCDICEQLRESGEPVDPGELCACDEILEDHNWWEHPHPSFSMYCPAFHTFIDESFED